MNISHWRHHSFGESPWRSTTVWTAGCSIHCPGCFNQQLWSPSAGRPRSLLRIASRAQRLQDAGLCIVGGEPFDQPWSLGFSLLLVRTRFAHLRITVHSGYTLKQLVKRPASWLALLMIDFLVDGPFVQALADEDLGYRGSKNQRVIDLFRTRETGHLSLANWDNRLVFSPASLHGPTRLMRDLLPDLAVSGQATCALLNHHSAHWHTRVHNEPR